jgi:hypothetical protein
MTRRMLMVAAVAAVGMMMTGMDAFAGNRNCRNRCRSNNNNRSNCCAPSCAAPCAPSCCAPACAAPCAPACAAPCDNGCTSNCEASQFQTVSHSSCGSCQPAATCCGASFQSCGQSNCGQSSCGNSWSNCGSSACGSACGSSACGSSCGGSACGGSAIEYSPAPSSSAPTPRLLPPKLLIALPDPKSALSEQNSHSSPGHAPGGLFSFLDQHVFSTRLDCRA